MSQVSKARRFLLLTIFVRPLQTAAIAALFVCLIPARAQDLAGDEVLRLRTDFVSVPAVVTDARGSRVAGLGKSDFELRSDGREVKVEYFSAGAERVRMLFALDTSGSTRELVAQQREAALALFSRFGANSSVGVLYFGRTANLALPFTTDASAAASALNSLAAPDDRTAIFDAAAEALNAFNAHAHDAAERRIVVLLSDGLDNASRTSAKTVIKIARERGVSFYVIHLALYEPRDGRLVARRTAKGFRALAEETGGKYFMLGNRADALSPRASYNLAPVFNAIEEDLRGQYVLGFYPEEAARDGRFHEIGVRLAPGHKSGLRAHSLREGFILPSQ